MGEAERNPSRTQINDGLRQNTPSPILLHYRTATVFVCIPDAPRIGYTGRMIDWSDYAKFFIGLLAIVNPIGIVPVFVGLTRHLATEIAM